MRRIMQKASVLGILALTLSAFDADAGTLCGSSVVQSWQTERDAAASRLLKLWLRRAPVDRVREAGFELVRLEILLVPCVPPLSLDSSYLNEVTDPDPDRLPAAVFKAFLKRHGVRLDARDFLVGQTFELPAVR